MIWSWSVFCFGMSAGVLLGTLIGMLGSSSKHP